ncbi:MAG: hypothetical protein D6736_16580 [Nitrospinota bacterium]|nr:MAG: hypothetical protein D6736_16580 [Nitrospinota bacterium]
MPLHEHHLPQQGVTPGQVMVSVEFDDEGKLIDVVYAPLDYHSFVVRVEGNAATLCRVQRRADPVFSEEYHYELEPLCLPLSPEETVQLQSWLRSNIEAIGGRLTLPGLYPISLPLPDWLRNR